jgi:hypothetical protein
MLQHCHTNMPLLPSGPPWFVFMVLAMLPVTLMQHSLAAHAMHAYLLCPAQQGSQPTGWHRLLIHRLPLWFERPQCSGNAVALL